jgi:hypothetical protein
MANDWFIQVMGEEQGPLTAAQLKKLASNGTITADTLVRRGPTADWVLAERVQGLFISAGDAPPLPPPPIQPFHSTVGTSNQPSAGADKPNGPATTIVEFDNAIRNIWRKFVYLIDPMFERYLTPWIVRLTWLLLLVGSVLLVGQAGTTYYRGLAFSSGRMANIGAVAHPLGHNEGLTDRPSRSSGYLDSALSSIGYMAEVLILLLAWILVLLWARVICELAIVQFNISTRLRSIDDRLAAMQPPE